MSKRAEIAAYNYAKENGTLGYDYNQIYDAAKNGYEQAEKDTIERAAKWIMEFENQLKVRFRITDTEFLEQFRKEMEEE